MIPDTISKDHIILAIREIDEKGYPQINEPTTYFIRYNDKKYPAKYTISLANKFVNGKPLSLHDFAGGSETNDFLKSRGFEIVSVSQEKSELKSIDKEFNLENLITVFDKDRNFFHKEVTEEAMKFRAQFISDFPPDKILDIKIDDYVEGKKLATGESISNRMPPPAIRCKTLSPSGVNVYPLLVVRALHGSLIKTSTKGFS